MTTQQAATIGRCSAATIGLLLTQGKLQGVQVGARKRWNVTTPRQEIRSIVLKEAPKSGWHKKAARNGHPAVPLKAERSDALHAVVQWLTIPEASRELLLQIATRFSAGDLKILTEL